VLISGVMRIAKSSRFLEMCGDDAMYYRGHGAFLLQGYLFEESLFPVGDKGYDTMRTRKITRGFWSAAFWSLF